MFLSRLGATEGRAYRLPTEAEWEYACRAGTTTPFFFGDSLSLDQANTKERRGMRPTPVGSFPPNAWGLFDMHGNVGEWCEDVHYSDRVYRGGGWEDPAAYCQSADRSWYQPSSRSVNLGFRVALSPSGKASESGGR